MLLHLRQSNWVSCESRTYSCWVLLERKKNDSSLIYVRHLQWMLRSCSLVASPVDFKAVEVFKHKIIFNYNFCASAWLGVGRVRMLRHKISFWRTFFWCKLKVLQHKIIAKFWALDNSSFFYLTCAQLPPKRKATNNSNPSVTFLSQISFEFNAD